MLRTTDAEAAKSAERHSSRAVCWLLGRIVGIEPGASSLSVVRRYFFRMIDDQNIERTFARFQLQTQLFLDRGK